MTTRPPLTPIIAPLPSTIPFVGPEAHQRESGRIFRARIGANESSFGPSPRVLARMQEAARDMWMYCDPENHDLRVALAAHLGVDKSNVVAGEGIDGLLGLAVRMYVSPGDAVVTSLGGYPTFNFHVAGAGGRLVAVPYENDRASLDGMLEAVRREKAPLVYLSNPDNPMGTWWEANELVRFMEALPQTTMLILDEAYGETAPASARPPVEIGCLNLLRMRTFSKAYGLAGIRCGYAFADAEVIASVEKIRNHFGVSRMAQIAGMEALADQAYLAEVVDRIARARERIASVARDNGLSPIASATNFVTIDCGRDADFAMKLMQNLLARDVFVRKPMAPVLNRCIRVSAGVDREMDIFAEELPAALAAARLG